jgi:hypothetical protein
MAVWSERAYEVSYGRILATFENNSYLSTIRVGLVVRQAAQKVRDVVCRLLQEWFQFLALSRFQSGHFNGCYSGKGGIHITQVALDVVVSRNNCRNVTGEVLTACSTRR